MNDEKRELLILMEEQSYLSASFEKTFEKQGLPAKIVHISAECADMLQDEAAGLLICASTELQKKIVSVKVLVDQAIKNGVTIFAMGNVEELDLMWKTISQQMIQDIFIRPINMSEVVERICKRLEEAQTQQKKVILAVDDSGVVLRKIKNLLEDDYQVVMANSGAMALKYLALNTPDLILLDYEMPIVDGKQVMQMIREDTEYREIPIIFLTGKNDAESVMDVMSMKPEGYLLKTMEPEKLHQSIDNFFGKPLA